MTRALAVGCALLGTGLSAGCAAGAAAAPEAVCLQPSDALLDRLVSLAPAGSGFRVLDSAAHVAEGHAATHFVAVRFAVRGKADLTGVWAVGRKLDGTGTVLAVDADAQEWSVAMAADEAAADIRQDEGADAVGCL